MHLLRGGVDVNTVRDWLGHVSLNTTNVYAELDLEMKAKARHEAAAPYGCSQALRPGACGATTPSRN